MPATFTRAIEVQPGDRLTSRQQRSLARAANDRLRFAEDLPWRVAWALYNMARLVRNPAADGLTFPAEGEFWRFYAHTSGSWPVAGPGDPEGANLGSLIPQFVFGNAELPDEPDRLIQILPLDLAGNPPADEWERWLLGALQRGATTGTVMNAPALEAAQTIWRFAFHPLLWHGKSFGGFQPQAPVDPNIPWCDTISPYDTWPNHIYYWTSFDSSADTSGLHGTVTTLPDGRKRVTYAGSCPCGSANAAAGHVLGRLSLPFAWYIAVWDGTYDANGNCNLNWDRLPKNEWQEGPYDGAPVPQHSDYPGIARTVWHYINEFRGSDSQRSNDRFNIERIAFDAQRFWTRQYPLAPARGILQGSQIVAVYPSRTWTADPGPGPHALQDENGVDWAPHAGFVLAGFVARAVNLQQPVDLIISTGVRQHRLSLTPAAPVKILWLPDAEAATALTVTLDGALSLGTGGSLEVHAAELLEYKPNLEDQYLLLRLTTADAAGPDYEGAQTIVRDLFQNGVLLGVSPAALGNAITTNPLYQSFRRLSRRVRFIGREQLISYEVAADGSVRLRFNRNPPGLSLPSDDAFEGIAPPPGPIASGDLVSGETYIVRGTSGAVTHNGVDYSPGVIFVAVNRDYTASGDAEPWVYNGIRKIALPRGWSNEWVMFLETHGYHESESVIWKPSLYADFFTFLANEHFWSPTSGGLRPFVNATYAFDEPSGTPPISSLQPVTIQSTMINPEAPSAYTYALGANQNSDAAFKKSRQVYPKPYEVKSCTLEFNGGNQIVVVELESRLRYHPNAPATVDADPNNWSTDDRARLDGTHSTWPEDWRTDDNAVREYLRYVNGDGAHCSFKTGDVGYGGAPIPSIRGACFPGFWFVQLVPECYEDNNETWNSHDTRVLAETHEYAGLILDTICEAFVDGEVTVERTCENANQAGLYDYTRESLYAQTAADRSLAPFPTSVRPDRPMGFGPLVNTRIYADTHNRLARAFNQLTRLRLDVPLIWEARERWYESKIQVNPTVISGTCDSTIRLAWLDGGVPPAAQTLTYDSGWVEYYSPPTLLAFHGSGLGCCDDPNFWCLASTAVTWEWRVRVDTAWLDALPQHIQELVNIDQIRTVAVVNTERYHYQRVDGPPYSECDGVNAPYRWDRVDDTVSSECRMLAPALLSEPTPAPGDFMVHKPSGPSESCEYGSVNSALYIFLAFTQASIEVELTDLV